MRNKETIQKKGVLLKYEAPRVEIRQVRLEYAIVTSNNPTVFTSGMDYEEYETVADVNQDALFF
jgi:hypothetical protein